ncbi:pyrroline-5-carboxylate reductase dimerization domain-containing protein [Fructilactobacillus sp. Tb1]|uniref:pyrroline-5-carboxylate reductase dimerization domain-containing protein n=1 Tax=Fructilactobacillus sp. Tb1 TaxID=3422304 RepID=UPI003D2DDFFC
MVGTVAGCGPAFVDVFLGALSDAAVQNGLDRETSYQVAAAMVMGSAKMALDTKLNPAELKDQVTSPGGSTIKGVVALDANGFRNAVNQAVNKANGTYKDE